MNSTILHACERRSFYKHSLLLENAQHTKTTHGAIAYYPEQTTVARNEDAEAAACDEVTRISHIDLQTNNIPKIH